MVGALPYALLLVLFFGVEIFSEYRRWKGFRRILLFSILLIVLVAFFSLKSDAVGTDTAFYKKAYDTTVQSGALYSTSDRGFYTFMLLVAKLRAPFFVFQLCFYFISVGLLGYSVFLLSKKPFLALVLFLGTPLFPMFLSGMRQTLAIAFCAMAAAIAVRGRKWWKICSLPLWLLAITFHSSALCFALFGLVFLFRHSKTTLLCLSWVYFFVLVFGASLFSVLYQFRDLGYFLTSYSLGVPFNSLLFFVLFVGCYLGFLFSGKEENRISLIMCFPFFMYCMFMSTSSFSEIMSRFSFFFAIFPPIVISNLFASRFFGELFRRKALRLSLKYLFLTFFAFLCIYNCCINNVMHTFPYSLRFL